MTLTLHIFGPKKASIIYRNPLCWNISERMILNIMFTWMENRTFSLFIFWIMLKFKIVSASQINNIINELFFIFYLYRTEHQDCNSNIKLHTSKTIMFRRSVVFSNIRKNSTSLWPSPRYELIPKNIENIQSPKAQRNPGRRKRKI